VGGGGVAYERGVDANRVKISDFGLTWGVLGKSPLFSAVKFSLRVARGEI